MAGQFVVYFDREKDTLRTWRYEERVLADGYVRVGKLYINKVAVAELGNPETLRITIEDGDST